MEKTKYIPVHYFCLHCILKTKILYPEKKFWILYHKTILASHYPFNHYLLKKTSMYLPNLLELSLRIVLALPKDSNNGLASRICSVMSWLPFLLTAARYCITNLVASVFPDPLSPLKIQYKTSDLTSIVF